MPLTAAAAHPLLRRERRAALVHALLLSAGGAAAAYAAYRIYRSDGLRSTARSLARLRAALAAYADAFGTGADTLRLLLADLHAFLLSDRREVPPSLRQLARLMQSPEVADTTSATVAALWRGVAGEPQGTFWGARRPGGMLPALCSAAGTSCRMLHAKAEPPTSAAPPAAGGASGSPAATNGASEGTHPALEGSSGARAAPSSSRPALDRVLEALLSERGHSLVSVAVSLGARNLVSGYCEARHRLAAADRAAAGLGTHPPGAQPDLTNRLLDFLASPRGQQVVRAGRPGAGGGCN